MLLEGFQEGGPNDFLRFRLVPYVFIEFQRLTRDGPPVDPHDGPQWTPSFLQKLLLHLQLFHLDVPVSPV